jgi:ligand-binding sensor domain-containing protein
VERRRRGVVALGILLVCCPCAPALNPSLDVNQYAHTAWTVRDGSFKGTINAIAQTPEGYLWLGTEVGLVRFDGVRGVPWQPPTGQHLPSSDTRSLLAARDGRLWIGTAAGLTSWKDGKLTHYPQLNGQVVATLLEDREGTVWAGGWAISTGSLCAIQSGRAKCYGEDGSFGRGVASSYEDSAGSLWAGGTNVLWRWMPGPPKRYPMPDLASGINALIEERNGTLLIAMRDGIRQLVGGKSKAYPLPGAGRQFNPNRLLRDRNGGLWIGTSDRGLLHVHEGRTDLFARPDGLSGDSVESLFEDREGSIWIATTDGLDRFRDFAVTTISVKQGLSNASVFSVLAAKDGSVWVGTRDGLNRWNDGQITIYRRRSDRSLTRAAQNGVREITDSGLPDNVDSLFQDDHGRIWVSTSRGFAFFENGRFIPVSAVPGGVVHSIAGDSAGSIWIGYQDHGLFHLLGGSVVERIPWAKLGHEDSAATLLPDLAQGGLWLGFSRGGVAYFKDGQVRASYAGADGLGDGRINGLQLDGDGTLWAATEGGLSRVRDGGVSTLTSKNGLPCDKVNWVMEDDAHSFWLEMACGLVRIARPELDAWVGDPKRTIHATVFDNSDGVSSHALTSGYSPRVAKSSDGRLWFPGLDGVGVIDPRHLPFNKLPPQVHIEQIIADHRIHEASAHLRLPPLVRDLEIDYTALSLVAPEKVRFRYKLEGLDRDWWNAGNRRQAFYSNLSPGNYRFRVAACNNSGVWNEAGASFEFSKIPAFFQTTWFRCLCVAAFLGLLWALYRYRLHQVAHEFEVRMEERLAERNRIAQELHDNLLQSMLGISLQLEVTDELLPADAGARRPLEKALSLSKAAMAEGRRALNDLRVQGLGSDALVQAFSQLAKDFAGAPAPELFSPKVKSGHSRVPPEMTCCRSGGKLLPTRSSTRTPEESMFYSVTAARACAFG